MLLAFGLIVTLIGIPAATLSAQSAATGAAACRCEPDDKPRRPRFLLPIVGGLGFLPISVAARDSVLPMLGLPALVDIRDASPRNALEGERALAVGALAPDTATALPTVMVFAIGFLLGGAYFLLPRRRRRRALAWRSRDLGRRGGWRLRTVPRRRAGAALATCGGLLLLLGSREYAEGAQAQRRARAEWFSLGDVAVRIDSGAASVSEMRARRESSGAPPGMEVGWPATDGGRGLVPAVGPSAAVPLPVLAVSGREIRRGTPVARLVIPSIDLDEIVMEGVGPVELNGGPGHFPGSVLPGDAGNSILSAHRDRHFRRVGELGIGDRIRTETRSGPVDWTIVERRIVTKDTPSLFEETDATLTLTTCWPLRYFGSAPDRLLIIAKRVS